MSVESIMHWWRLMFSRRRIWCAVYGGVTEDVKKVGPVDYVTATELVEAFGGRIERSQ